MKKIVALVSGLALAGCVNLAYQDDEFPIVDEPTGTLVSLEANEPVQPVQLTQSAQPQVIAEQPAPVKTNAMAGANVIEISAQKFYITDDGVILSEADIQAEQAFSAPVGPMAVQPIIVQQEPVYQPQEVMITLQSQTYPVQYMTCSSLDAGCMNGAMAQGFIPMQYAPQFAGYQNVLGPTDYPAGGRWRNSNNIPRW